MKMHVSIIALLGILMVVMPSGAAEPGSATETLQKGKLLFDKGDYDRAIGAFTEAIRLDPKNIEAYSNRANALCKKGEYDKAIADCTEAVRLKPDFAPAYYCRGSAYANNGDHDKAIADFDAVVKLRPNRPCYYEGRALVRTRRGDYEGGIADFQTAIRLDPNDPAAKFETSSKEPLTVEAIQHGDRQVRQMLRDRPLMAQFGAKAGVLHEWAARKFAGEDLHERFLWDASEPLFCDADIQCPTGGRSGYIRIRRTYCDVPNEGKEQTFETMWSCAVFELYNIANAKDFQRLKQEAVERKLTKEQFVTKIVQCESCAAERTRAFYIHVFLPWAKEQHVPTDPGSWYVACRSDSAENLLLSSVDKRGRYWRHYENRYDSLLLNSLINKGDNEKAIAMAATMAKQATTNEEKAAIYFDYGRVYCNKGDYDQAITDCTEAIRLKPSYAEAYYNRGIAHGRKGDYDKTILDCTQAIRLKPDFADAYQCRGWAYGIKDASTKAISDYTEAARLDPTNATTYIGLGLAHMMKREYAKAIADLTEAVRLDPELAQAYYLRGITHDKLGDKAKAEEDFAQAKKLDHKAQ